LGGALLPFLWHVGSDYAAADGWTLADNLRVFPVLSAVFYQG
jgi:hypothetical protein